MELAQRIMSKQQNLCERQSESESSGRAMQRSNGEPTNEMEIRVHTGWSCRCRFKNLSENKNGTRDREMKWRKRKKRPNNEL